jgi:hypothetical protein
MRLSFAADRGYAQTSTDYSAASLVISDLCTSRQNSNDEEPAQAGSDGKQQGGKQTTSIFRTYHVTFILSWLHARCTLQKDVIICED